MKAYIVFPVGISTGATMWGSSLAVLLSTIGDFIVDLYDEYRQLKTNRIRTRFIGSAGGIAFPAGAAFAGKCMIWMGMFRPGTTPNSEILAYWPGFLIGGVVLGFPAAYAARTFYDFYLNTD